MFTKTVENAIKTLQKVATDLESVAVARANESLDLNKEIDRLSLKSSEALTEQDRATRIKEKIDELLQ